MKNNKYFLLGMLAAVLTFSLVTVGCDTGTGGDSGTSDNNGTGGNIMFSDSVVGSWVYVLSNGNIIGFAMNETVTPGTYVGVGSFGASSLINKVTTNGGSFFPPPSTSSLPTDYYFWGTKQ
ncbi:MAG: hypothetical protein LBG22_04265 [Treponema sp.]|jgi:hypothetical protein|nr:hypothetical protein [Treponema sp.]